MISVVFDPDARAEFLEAVQYYEDSQAGLGRRFQVTVEAAVKSIAENPLRYPAYYTLHLGVIFCRISLTPSFIVLNLKAS